MRVQARCIFSPWNTQRDAFWYVVSIQFSPEESQCVLKKKFEAWDAPSKMPELGRPEGILGVAQRRDACHVVAGAAAPASSDGSWSLSGSAAHVKEVAKDCGMFSYKKLDSTQKPSKPNETASTRLKRRPASVNEPLVKAEVQQTVVRNADKLRLQIRLPAFQQTEKNASFSSAKAATFPMTKPSVTWTKTETRSLRDTWDSSLPLCTRTLLRRNCTLYASSSRTTSLSDFKTKPEKSDPHSPSSSCLDMVPTETSSFVIKEKVAVAQPTRHGKKSVRPSQRTPSFRRL
ncbi:hypothetical protein L596_013562 [Steinernema carpocapsae]|uniref:Uncharacterized protein n=1 Tax=Steinernema carpocapsae TaxID=34508 RepID=A0A4U5P1E4_STECR|nr:hypothetical protein L596_013562 [Steinernema carpocapsae]